MLPVAADRNGVVVFCAVVTTIGMFGGSAVVYGGDTVCGSVATNVNCVETGGVD